VAALRHAPEGHDQHDHGERDVDEEDPAPGGYLYQPAAEDRPITEVTEVNPDQVPIA
jgi:hypothetical protein